MKPSATDTEPPNLDRFITMLREDKLRGDAHSVERFPAPRGQIVLVGYDKNGAVTLELRLPEYAYRKSVVRWLQAWLRALDADPFEALTAETREQ